VRTLRRGFVKSFQRSAPKALPSPQVDSVPSFQELTRIAQPLYEAWERRENLYGSVYYLGQLRSYQETKELFERSLEALLHPHKRKEIVEKYPELEKVINLAVPLVQARTNVLSHWIEALQDVPEAPYLREALTLAGFYMAYRIRKGEVGLKEGMDLYHFYMEMGLRKTAYVISRELMHHIDPDALESWDKIMERIGHYKHTLKDIISSRLNEVGVEAIVIGRKKTPFSSYRKSKRRDIPLEQLGDLIGLEVVVKEEDLEKAVRAVLVALKSFPHGYVSTIEDYRNKPPIPLPSGLLKGIDYLHKPREDGYSSIHVNVYPNIEVKITPKEAKLSHEEGKHRHTLYKQAIEPDRAKEALLKTLSLWKKNLIIRIKDGNQLYELRPDMNEYGHLPVEVLFSKGNFYNLLQELSPYYNGRNVILEIEEENELQRFLGRQALLNRSTIEVTLEVVKIRESNSKVVLKVVKIME